MRTGGDVDIVVGGKRRAGAVVEDEGRGTTLSDSDEEKNMTGGPATAG